MQAWGKCDKELGLYLPLIVHLCDVSACFSVLIDLPLYQNRLTCLAGKELSPALRQQLCLFAFLHDIGKLNSGFQSKGWNETVAHLEKAGHTAEGLDLIVSEIASTSGLDDLFDRWGEGSEGLFLAVLSHHGKPVNLDRYIENKTRWRQVADYDPVAELKRVIAFMRSTFPLAIRDGEQVPGDPEFQHLVAGLVALADQIGSMTDRFPMDRDVTPDLFRDCLSRANATIGALKLDVTGIHASVKSLPAASAFGWPEGARPKPMQEACWVLDGDAHLAILESETGSGKTEAAFLRFTKLFSEGLVDGLYFAVPTRAAASALHGRIDQAAQRVLGTNAILALPGYLKVGEATGRALPDWRVLWDDNPDELQRSSRWAAETPRRFLAAPIAVGTVDQAMMAGLKVKWAHFRAATLARSLLVIDEVHASDVYMTKVLSRLLETHVGNGGYALLMSATLGGAARKEWLGARRSGPADEMADHFEQVAYPSLSIRRRSGGTETIALPHDGRTKKVSVDVVESMESSEQIADLAAEAAGRGAKVLVIRNTVASALAMLKALECRHPDAPVLAIEGVTTLHHSRFASEDRLLLDRAIETGFGKRSGHRAIIAVGTQTLEQSLDISCDVLISDLCPVDVLLQRIGRLHRHELARPKSCRQPVCHVLTPKTLKPDAGLLRYGLGQGTNGGVYQSMTGLEATRRLIVDRPIWTIPQDNRLLVEVGTDPVLLDNLAGSLGEDWKKERIGIEGRSWSHKNAACFAILDRRKPFDGRTEVFPDDENIMTRLGVGGLVLSFAPVSGPFGKQISQITIPSHMLGGATADDVLHMEAGSGALLLTLGPSVYSYSRYGLEKVENA